MSAANPVRPISLPARHPVTRQIIALVGNRYVVFGSQNRLPIEHILGPSDIHAPNLSRVGDEYEFDPERLVESIVVEGAEVTVVNSLGPDVGWDIKVQYPDHPPLLVGIKIRTRDLTRNEFEKNASWIKSIRTADQGIPEVWNFNIERLRLTIMTLSDIAPSFDEIDALNVWEPNRDGSAFERSYVLGRVEDWKIRVNGVFNQIQLWSTEVGIKSEATRTVIMAEEIMQRFAVPDQIMPVLDVSQEGDYLLSFVPTGLWIFGSNGRINVLGRNGTLPLLDLSRELGTTDWRLLADKTSMQFEEWNKDVFLRLVAKTQFA